MQFLSSSKCHPYCTFRLRITHMKPSLPYQFILENVIVTAIAAISFQDKLGARFWWGLIHCCRRHCAGGRVSNKVRDTNDIMLLSSILSCFLSVVKTGMEGDIGKSPFEMHDPLIINSGGLCWGSLNSRFPCTMTFCNQPLSRDHRFTKDSWCLRKCDRCLLHLFRIPFIIGDAITFENTCSRFASCVVISGGPANSYPRLDVWG